MLLERTAALAKACDEAEADTKLRAELANLDKRATAATAIVVVGETKRGKSSLINALLGRQRLLPVDADVATSVHLAIHHAEKPGARVTIADGAYLSEEVDPGFRGRGHRPGRFQAKVLDIDLEDIGEFASVAGNPDNQKNVTAVEIGLDDPLLARGVTLVDTPGVGGLEAGHSAITLAQLHYADALIFVVDATAPITDPELRFLEAATERIETVVFVMTKIDAHPGWKALLEEDQALIARHAPRYKDCPFLPVSSQLKSEADAANRGGHTDRAQRLYTQSRFQAFVDTLESDVLARAATLRLANLTRIATSVLAGLERDQQVRRRSAEGDPTLQAELEAEQARYAEHARAEASWRVDLQHEFSDLQINATRELNRAMADIKKWAAIRIEGASSDLYGTMPGEVADTLEGHWTDVNKFLQDSVQRIVTRLTEKFELEGAPISFEDIPLPERLRELPVMRRTPEPQKDRSLKGLIAEYFPGITMGALGLNALLSMGLGVTFGLLPLMVGGVALQKVMNQARRGGPDRIRNQQDATRFVQEILADAGIELGAEMQKRMAELRWTLEGEIGSRLARRKEALTATLQRHQTALQAAQRERQQAQAHASRTLAQVAELGRESANLLRALAVPAQEPAAESAPSPTPPTPALAPPATPAPQPVRTLAPAENWLDES
jgi:tRNA U34 5-carboxymethylaminomethyl modifying GTPase MnmE/TrmE